MAFNHVGNCDCPVGCCDCGVDYARNKRDEMVREFVREMMPKDLIMDMETGELSEIERVKPEDRFLRTNKYYIGKIDPVITLNIGIAMLFKLHAFIVENDFPKYGREHEYITKLLRDLSRLDLDYKALHDAIVPLYKYEGSKL